MGHSFRKMSYERLATFAHTPEGRAEMERRQSRGTSSSVDFDGAVAETVTLVKRALLTRVLANLGLPPA